MLSVEACGTNLPGKDVLMNKLKNKSNETESRSHNKTRGPWVTKFTRALALNDFHICKGSKLLSHLYILIQNIYIEIQSDIDHRDNIFSIYGSILFQQKL